MTGLFSLTTRKPLAVLLWHVRSKWIATVTALFALLVAAAVVLVLAIDGGSSGAGVSVSERAQPALRSDGGPEESSVAASISSRPSAGPDENRTAAAISGR